MLITCWYLCFPVSWALWFAICCRCLASRRSVSSPLTLWFLHSHSASAFFSDLVCYYADPLHNQPSLESAILCGRCSQQYTDAVLTLLHSFIKRDGSVHIYIYIYIHTYIHTYKLAQNRTAVIKISYKQLFLLCLLQLLLTVCINLL